MKFFNHIFLRAPKKNQKIIYLTFDDGPHNTLTPFITNLLADFNFKATFFLLGLNVKEKQTLTHLYKPNNCEIANHGYLHLNGFTTKSTTYIKNIMDGEKAINEIFNTKNELAFRPPYGKLNIKTIFSFKKRPIVGWSLMSYDFDTKIETNKILKRLIAKTKGCSIVVFHENDAAFKHLPTLLPLYFNWLKKQEYTTQVISHFAYIRK